MTGLTNTTNWAMAHDPGHRRVREAWPNGLAEVFSYDSADRLLGIEPDAAGDQGLPAIRYSYDRRGLRTGMNRSDAGSWAYQYDELGELVGVDLPGGTHQRYAYDPVGNRLEFENVRGLQRYFYDDADELLRIESTYPWEEPAEPALMVSAAVSDATRPPFVTEYGYDRNGSQVRRTGPGHAESSYAFNGYTRLVGVAQPGSATERYAYDPLGRRATITKGEGKGGAPRRFLHDGSRRVLAEVDAAGKLVTRHVHTPGGGLVARVDSSSNRPGFYHFDALGSTVAQSDGQGRITSRSVYDPYGARLNRPAVGDTFGFVGRAGVEEDGTELVLMGQRHYASSTGRFMSVDPLGRLGILIHPYVYAEGNPVSRTDPLGLSTLEFDRAAGTLTLYSAAGAMVGSYPAANNVSSKAVGDWPEGSYQFRKVSTAAPVEQVGPYGNFLFKNFVDPRTGLVRTVMGVHSGRSQPADPTLGCIRTTDQAMQDITETHATDPLTDLEVVDSAEDAGDSWTDEDYADWYYELDTQDGDEGEVAEGE